MSALQKKTLSAATTTWRTLARAGTVVKKNAMQIWSGPIVEKKTRQNADTEKVFSESIKFLLERDLWTFGALRHYQERMLELTGGTSLQSRLQGDNEIVKKIKTNIRILDTMDPFELASNHKDIFTPLSKRLIAEKANVEEDAVENLIREHDMLRADRRWYKIRQQFNRPLPRTSEEREILATRDRPLSQTEKELVKREQLKQVHKHMNMKKLTQAKAVNNLYYRHPSKGFDRWRTRPPRQEPVFSRPPRIHKSNTL